MKKYELAVIGGGPAGMAAAVEAWKCGIRSIAIIERDKTLGGILPQCVHTGFGIHEFGEELTGPEYADRFIEQISLTCISSYTETMALDISVDRVITALNQREGLLQIKAQAVVLAMGCRERTRGALNIPGTRPAGIMTAGTAQRFVNIDGYMPGREVLILGSGDIGLIMARRMTLEGAKVHMVCEKMPYPGGLARNVAQCLDDFRIPLRLGCTVTGISGGRRLESVTLSENEEKVKCDTMLLSVGLIPENELSVKAGVILDPLTSGPYVDAGMQTLTEGIFACGNVVHVHDLADYVTEEGRLAGRNAAAFINGERMQAGFTVNVRPGEGVRYTVPHKIYPETMQPVKLLFRASAPFKDAEISVEAAGHKLFSERKKVVMPGEMQTAFLDATVLQKISGTEIKVDIWSRKRGTNA